MAACTVVDCSVAYLLGKKKYITGASGSWAFSPVLSDSCAGAIGHAPTQRVKDLPAVMVKAKNKNVRVKRCRRILGDLNYSVTLH